jgi:DNA polymerase-3 subunit epsilon
MMVRKLDQFISLVNPKVILLFCAEINQYYSKMVKTAPKFHEIAKRIVEITANTTW